MSELPDLSLLTSAQKDELIRELFRQVQMLSAQVAQLMAERNKNSSNSSKPPSSDGLAKKKTKSLRQPSGKKPGGQVGHEGHALKRSNHPNQVIQHVLPDQCDACGCALNSGKAEILERRQVLEIPQLKCDVIEHQTVALRCRCGKMHISQFPSNVTETVQYGPNLRALGVALTQWQLLPVVRASELIEDLFQVRVSVASLLHWAKLARQKVQPEVDGIAAQLRREKVVHADESGLRVQGELQWLHVAATEKYTWYGIHQKRGMEAIREYDILPKLTGVLVHDCWQPYWDLPCTHALCNAHLMRELQYTQEITQQEWPQKIFNFLLNSSQICAAAHQQNAPLRPQSIADFKTVYSGLLSEGELLHPEAARVDGRRGRVKQSIPHNLLKRLRQHTDAVLRFIHDPTVPFTNNTAERCIRMPKVKQKISGSFRTTDGAETFAVIRSYLDTLHKQGHSIFNVLRHVFAGDLVKPTAWG